MRAFSIGATLAVGLGLIQSAIDTYPTASPMAVIVIGSLMVAAIVSGLVWAFRE